MSECFGCKWAVWDRTTNGRLHPNKAGRCMWALPLTTAFPMVLLQGWGSPAIRALQEPAGRYIERGRQHDCKARETAA